MSFSGLLKSSVQRGQTKMLPWSAPSSLSWGKPRTIKTHFCHMQDLPASDFFKFLLGLSGVTTHFTCFQLKHFCMWYMVMCGVCEWAEILTSPSDLLTVTWCWVQPQVWVTHKLKYRTFSNRRSRHITYWLIPEVFCSSPLNWCSCHFSFWFILMYFGTQKSQVVTAHRSAQWLYGIQKHVLLLNKNTSFIYQFYSFDIRNSKHFPNMLNKSHK